MKLVTSTGLMRTKGERTQPRVPGVRRAVTPDKDKGRL